MSVQGEYTESLHVVDQIKARIRDMLRDDELVVAFQAHANHHNGHRELYILMTPNTTEPQFLSALANAANTCDGS